MPYSEFHTTLDDISKFKSHLVEVNSILNDIRFQMDGIKSEIGILQADIFKNKHCEECITTLSIDDLNIRLQAIRDLIPRLEKEIISKV